MDPKIFNISKLKYSELTVDVDKIINILKDIPISIHAWQLDDVSGFESKGSELNGGGILSIGNYPGKATKIDQMREDLEMVLKLVPGTKKIALQAHEGDFGDSLSDRLDISRDHFDSWIDWAKKHNLGIDLNPVLYSHPKADTGYTLSSLCDDIRNYWIEYTKKVREIASYIGEKLDIPCISFLWIPDGSKDVTPSRYDHRVALKESMDTVYSIKYAPNNLIDCLESKLFGIGYEFYNVGSLEFYLSYASQNNLGIALDTGHFHPTELVSDKISAILPFIDNIALHLSRGIRWDSDHVTTLSEELIAICQEVVRADAFSKVHFGTDFFDASINRVGALALGARSVVKALLYSLLEPTSLLKKNELEGNNFARLAILEDLKTAPFGIIWDQYCREMNVPTNMEWIDEVMKYEENILRRR